MTESIPYLLTFALALLATGAAAGVIAGLLGVGGGIIIVPILYSVFDILEIDQSVSMHMAVGTSLATIIPTAVASVAAHNRRRAVDWTLFRIWLPWLLVGVFVGTWLANTALAGTALTKIFGSVALIVALDLLIRRRVDDPHQVRPDSIYRHTIAPVPGMIGAFSSMMGIGGGTLTVPFLNALSYPMHQAIATSAGFGLVIAVPAATGFMIGGWDEPTRPVGSLGYINVIGFVLITVTSVFTAPLGSWLTHTLSAKTLRLLFAAFLLLTAVRMLGLT